MVACMDKIVGRIAGKLDSLLVNEQPTEDKK